MARSSFYKIFPVPEFLEMPAAGLDISDSVVRFVELSETRKGLVLGKYGERSIPEGVVVAGEIKNREALKKVLSDLSKELTSRFVVVSLPEEQAYLLELNIATEQKSQVRGLLELQLEENVPIPPAEVVFDYEVAPERHAHKGTMQVAVSAVQGSLVGSYLDAFKGTGLVPVALEVEPESIARAVILAGDKGTYMITDFGRTRTGISIVSGGAVSFTSTVPIGGYSLTKAIAKELGVSLEEAEKIKRENGFVRTQENEKLFAVLMSTVSILRDELIRHYNYWHAHPNVYGERRDPVSRVILCGGDSNLNGFTEFLAMGLHSPVELANVMQNVNSFDRYVPEIAFNDSLRYATAVGLALVDQNNAMNLLPQSEQKQVLMKYRMRLSVAVIGTLSILVTSAGVLLLPAYIIATNKVTLAQAQLDQAAQQGGSGVAVEDPKNVVRKIEATIALVEPAAGQRSPSPVINELLKRITPGITLDNIFFSVSDKGGNLNIHGVAIDRKSLAAFGESLRNDPLFASTDIPPSSFVKKTNIDFGITIELSVSESEKKGTPQVVPPKS